MTTADRIAAALRPLAPEGKLKPNEVPFIDKLAALWDARLMPLRDDPAWVTAARSMLGQKEVPGPSHNSWIARGWAKLGASWYNNDETPWCGLFVAWCLNEAGLPYPKNFPAAKSFATYGEECTPRLGALAVKGRKGGNHVFFIVGETADKRFYKALGGNQRNMVSIVDIAKSEVDAVRWPSGVPQPPKYLPTLPAGTIGASEA